MSLKKAFLMSVSTIALLCLSGCEQMTPEEKAKQKEIRMQNRIKAKEDAQQKAEEARRQQEEAIISGKKTATLARYDLSKHVSVEEISTEANPDVTTIIVNGKEAAVAVASFKREQTTLGSFKLLSQFNIAGADVYEFQPASDSNIICTYVETSESTDVNNMRLNFDSVRIYSGAMSVVRRSPRN